MITVDQYFRAYAGHPEITVDMKARAAELLGRVNALLERAADDGWTATINPATGTWISGEQNGGWRPQACLIGAAESNHKQAQGVDVADPHGVLDKWCLTERGLQAMEDIGLWLEHPGWTDGWCHLQSVPPGRPPRPEVRVFIPSSAPPQTEIYGRRPVIRVMA